MRIRFAAILAAWLGLGLGLGLATATALADTVPEDERVGIDLRRTTLVVRDIERSLEFYRDALGMVPIYDNLILTPRDAAGVEDAERALRLVMLRANDDYIGVVGLLQYFKPRKETVDLTDTSFMEGTAVLLFNVDDLSGAFARASQVEGVVVLDEPMPVSYPSYDGEGVIEVIVSTLQDPDGFTIELNQLQSELR
ncbi:MAG: VOC family protein [Gammaproteobacteria bacterium]|nr:VOC family protein [Gammaproteobacteria bacterium]